jgi:hypothetical protein
MRFVATIVVVLLGVLIDVCSVQASASKWEVDYRRCMIRVAISGEGPEILNVGIVEGEGVTTILIYDGELRKMQRAVRGLRACIKANRG